MRGPPHPDPLGKQEFGGDALELDMVYSHQMALRELKQNVSSVAKLNKSEEQRLKEQQQTPNGEGDQKGKGKGKGKKKHGGGGGGGAAPEQQEEG